MSLTKKDLQAIGNLFDERFDKVDSRLDKVDSRLDALERNQEITIRSLLVIENEYIPKINVTLEGLVGAIEKNTEQDKRIKSLETKVENHDVRINAMEFAV